MLGKITGNAVIVKHKKQLVKIPEGNRITVACRKCGAPNSIYSSKFSEALKDGEFSSIKTSDGQELYVKMIHNGDDIKISFEPEHP